MNFRMTAGGVVHGLTTRFDMTAWCGRMPHGAEETRDPVSCRQCLRAGRAAGGGANHDPRPGRGRNATLPGSVVLAISTSDSGLGSQALASLSGFAITAAAAIRATLDNIRRPSDLELTDAALEELEQANLAAYRDLRDGAWIRVRGKLGRPSEAVRELVLRLQQQHEQSVDWRTLRNTVTAHDEILRLQGYLIPGGMRCDDCHVLLPQPYTREKWSQHCDRCGRRRIAASQKAWRESRAGATA